LPEMRVGMTPETLAAMREERRNGIENWHPATFHYESDAVPVMVRNRGNKYTPGAMCADKMQIAIDFNREDPSARWRGLRRITLDSGHCRIF
ncbi:hypothetical protein, partial [Enterococcus casseliflavus]|uniref:hypothetical protein n=1 Tax=Enterococcus casseliflavus TaxID=37734 RepID=UPI003D1249DE